MITIAKNQFVFFKAPGLFLTLSLASNKTTTGINFNENEISTGTIIKSSNKPRTGIKSGIRSIGLNKYPTVIAISAFAVTGVRLSLYAIIRTCASDLSFLALCFNSDNNLTYIILKN